MTNKLCVSARVRLCVCVCERDAFAFALSYIYLSSRVTLEVDGHDIKRHVTHTQICCQQHADGQLNPKSS